MKVSDLTDSSRRLRVQLAEMLRRWPAADGRLVVVSNYLDRRLEKFHHESVRTGRPWMLAQVDAGATPGVTRLGPLMHPGRTLCWQCLCIRLAMNERPDAAAVKARADRYGWIARQLEAWLSGASDYLDRGCILEWKDEAVDARPAVHYVVGWHPCPNCDALPLPESGWQRLVSPLSGIVQSVNHRRVGPSLFLCSGEGSVAHYVGQSGQLTRLPASIAIGLAATRDGAEVRCLAEAAERYSLQSPPAGVVRQGSLAELGDEAIDPRELFHIHDLQYEGKVGPYPWERLRRFDPEEGIDWLPARRLTGRRPLIRWVAAACCLLELPAGFWLANSNGCAAGRSVADATLRGLLEVVERDAMAIWWYNRIPRRRLEWRRLGASRMLEAAAEALADRGRRVEIFDITTDIEIPAVAAVTTDRLDRLLAIGSAAHPDPSIAVEKALLEVLKTDVLFPVADPGPPLTGKSAWWRRPPVEDRRPTLFRPGRVKVSLTDVLARFECRGLEAYAVEMTRPEVGVPVVRAVVPGLRFWTPQWGPGRLYRVPVELGWRKRATPLTRLNSELMPHHRPDPGVAPARRTAGRSAGNRRQG